MTMLEKAILRDVGVEPAVWFLTNRMTILAEPEETSNAYSLVHTLTQSNGAPPPHLHRREDEVFYMIRGTGKFLVKDLSFEAGPGSLTFLPRGLAHLPVLTSEDAEVLILATPGEYSNFFKQQSIPAATSGLPTITQAYMPMMEDILSLGGEFGLSFLPPGAAVSCWPVPEVHAEPKHLTSGEGHLIEFFDSQVTVKLAANDTQGQISIFEIQDKPKGEFPKHVSHLTSEGFYVLEGAYEFMVGDRVLSAAVGSFVYAPAGVQTSYRCVGPEDGKLLLIAPGKGHESFFRAPFADALPSEIPTVQVVR